MPQSLKVLVYGATGSQARPIVYKLLEKGHTPYALTRHANKAADLQAAGAQIAIGTLEDAASLQAASEGMDAIVFMIPAFLEKPAEALQYAHNAIDAAKAAGVKLIVWNTSGPVLPQRTGNPMSDLRLDVRDVLQASGIPHVVFEPMIYVENLLGPWTAPAVAQHNRVSYPIQAHKKVGWLASDDLGALIVSALEQPQLAGSHFQVSGVEAVTGPELAAIFAQVLQRDITYYAMSPDEMGAVLNQVFGPGAGDAVAEEYRKQQNDPHPPPQYNDMSIVLDKLPITMTPLSAWVSQHAQAFSAVSEH